MRLEQLRYFVEVCDKGSIHKAANSLYVSQPNISRAISNLEEEVGRSLLLRGNHGIKLTKAGESVYHYAKSIVSHMETISGIKLAEDFELVSNLKVAVAFLILQDDFMLLYNKQIEAERKNIHLVETNLEGALQSVVNLESEIGVMVVTSAQLPVFKKVLELRELQMKIVSTSPLYLHMHQNSALAKKDDIEAKDLCQYTYLHLPEDFFSNINDSCGWEGIQISDFKKVVSINNYHAIINMINHTDAFMFGNRWEASELKKSNIKSVPMLGIDIELTMVWVSRKKAILSEEAEFFIQMITNQYGQK